METTMKAFPLKNARLLSGLFLDRFNLNRRYVMSLQCERPVYFPVRKEA